MYPSLTRVVRAAVVAKKFILELDLNPRDCPAKRDEVAGSDSLLASSAMGLFSFLRSVFDLDNLDTRFTTPSSVPYRTLAEARREAIARGERATRPDPKAQPSKWGTPEFYLYYLVFIVAVPYMFWVAYEVSRRTPPPPRAAVWKDPSDTRTQPPILDTPNMSSTCRQDGFRGG